MASVKKRIKQPKPRRNVVLTVGASNRVAIRYYANTTRLTFEQRIDGEITIRLRPYRIGDEYLTAADFEEESFEEITNGTIDLATGKYTLTFTGEYSAMIIDDTAYAGEGTVLSVEVHQK